MPGQPRVEPRLPDVGRVDRQALAQGEPAGGGLRGQLVDLRPRALRVDVIRGERGDAAPVVDPGGQDHPVLVTDQVRRGLDPGLRAEHQPGDGDGRGEVRQLGVGHAAHPGVRLGPEVLHDDFLDAAVLAGDPTDREDRFGPLGERLADADEDPGGERHAAAPGVLEHAQPDRGVLVRAAVVRGALLGEQPRRRGLQHHAHRRRHRLEPLEVRPAQDARVEMRQQAGLFQHADRHGPHVGQGVVVAARVQPLPRLVPAVLGAVAQREQGFLAAQRGALTGDGQHLAGLQVGAVQAVRDRRERAVPAAVAAQPGQRDEDLPRIRDHAGTPGGGQARVPGPAGVTEQRLQRAVPALQQDRGLAGVQGLAIPGAGQRPAQARLRLSGRRHALSLPRRSRAAAASAFAAADQFPPSTLRRGKMAPGRQGRRRPPGQAVRSGGSRGRTCGGPGAAGGCR